MYLQYDGKKSEEKILNISPCMLNDKWDEVRRLSKITKDLFSKKLEYQYLEEIKA